MLGLFYTKNKPFNQPSQVPYQSDNQKQELYDILKAHLSPKHDESLRTIDDFTLVHGIIGSYPAAYLSLVENEIHHWYKENQPVEFGLLDYNRFENR